MNRYLSAAAIAVALALPAGALESEWPGTTTSKADIVKSTQEYLDQGDIEGLARLGDQLYLGHHYEGLFFLCEHALKRVGDPKQRALAMRGMAEAYEGMKQWDNAIKTYKQVIKEFPNTLEVPWAQWGIAGCLAGKGHYDEAASLLRKTVQQWPAHDVTGLACERLGVCYLRTGKLKEAESAIKRALDEFPVSKYPRMWGYAWVGLMRQNDALPDLYDVYLAQQRMDAAAAEFERLRNNYPDIRAPATFWLARSLEWLGQHGRAAQEYETYISQWPSGDYMPRALLHAGICRWQSGDKKQGEAHWRRLCIEFAGWEPAQARCWLEAAGLPGPKMRFR
jgi:TolA-binding protein